MTNDCSVELDFMFIDNQDAIDFTAELEDEMAIGYLDTEENKVYFDGYFRSTDDMFETLNKFAPKIKNSELSYWRDDFDSGYVKISGGKCLKCGIAPDEKWEEA